MNFTKAILWFLVLVCAGIIFAFSNQPASESKATSKSVTEKIIDLSPKLRQLPPEEKKEIVNKFNTQVRKYAHFALFAIFGALVLMLLFSYKIEHFRAWLISVLISLLYAISDEIHQIFVPCRAFEVQDIFIDLIGIIIGSSIIALIKSKYLNKKKI
jgi:VanZ family protein